MLISVRFDSVNILASTKMRISWRHEWIGEFECSSCKELNSNATARVFIDDNDVSIDVTIRSSDGHAVRISVRDVVQSLAIIGQHGRVNKNLEIVDKETVVDSVHSSCETSNKCIF